MGGRLRSMRVDVERCRLPTPARANDTREMEKQSGRFNVCNMRIPQRAIRWRIMAPRWRRRAARCGSGSERSSVTASMPISMVTISRPMWSASTPSRGTAPRCPFPSVPVYTVCQDAAGSEPVRRRHRGDEDRPCMLWARARMRFGFVWHETSPYRKL